MPILGIAQERVTTFGVQAKPIIPSSLFRAGETVLTQNGIDYEVDHRLGYAMGGMIRIGLNKRFSLESGISFVRRNFRASAYSAAQDFGDTTSFGVIGYEIRVLGMVFIQLSDRWYMNTAFGLSLDMFPSDVSSQGPSQDFYQTSVRRGLNDSTSLLSWMKVGLVANLGYEFRTKESGYWYIGASYHLPFSSIYHSNLFYDRDGLTDIGYLKLSGNYLTVDLRYFFHEEPREKKRKRDPDTMPSWMKNQQ